MQGIQAIAAVSKVMKLGYGAEGGGGSTEYCFSNPFKTACAGQT